MSLVKPKLYHPITGVELLPLMHRTDGRPVWPVLGAAEDDDDDSEDSGEEDSDDDTDTSGEDGESSEKAGKGKAPSEADLARAEAFKAREGKRKAEKAAADALAKLQEIQDKDKSELEIANRELASLKERIPELEGTVRDLRIHNAFLASNKYSWHNPDRALRIADLKDVEIGEDGDVSGLDKALDSLAKSDPYLIKPADDEGDGETGKAPSGASFNGKRQGKTDRTRDELVKKYPALRR